MAQHGKSARQVREEVERELRRLGGPPRDRESRGRKPRRRNRRPSALPRIAWRIVWMAIGAAMLVFTIPLLPAAAQELLSEGQAVILNAKVTLVDQFK